LSLSQFPLWQALKAKKFVRAYNNTTVLCKRWKPLLQHDNIAFEGWEFIDFAAFGAYLIRS